MKKSLIILFVILCMTLTALAGCSGSSTETAKPTEAPAATEAPATAAATEAETEAEATEAAATEAAPADNEATSLVGTWEYEEMAGIAYRFNADGTGSYDMLGEVMEFTYTDKGGSVEIMYSDADVPYTADYTIEGDALIIKDSTGMDVKYIKK